MLGIKKRQVELQQGHKSRDKVLQVEWSVDPQTAIDLLVKAAK